MLVQVYSEPLPFTVSEDGSEDSHRGADRPLSDPPACAPFAETIPHAALHASSQKQIDILSGIVRVYR